MERCLGRLLRRTAKNLKGRGAANGLGSAAQVIHW